MFDKKGTLGLATAVWVTATAVIPAFLIGALGVQIKEDLGATNAMFGGMLALFYLSVSLPGRVSGHAVDRFGWQRATNVSALLTTCSLLGIAMIARSPLGFAVFVVAGGLGMSISIPVGNLILVQATGQARRGLAFGIKQSAFPLASMYAGISVPLLAVPHGYRVAFGFAALLPPCGYLLVRRCGDITPLPRGEGHAHLHAPLPPMRLLVAGSALATSTVGALTAYSVLSLVQSGFSVARAGMLVAVASAIGLMVRLALGHLSDRYQWDGLTSVSMMLVLGSTGFIALGSDNPVVVSVGLFVAYTAGWSWQGLFHYGVVREYPASAGRITGTVQVGLAGGMALGPLLFGAITTSRGYTSAWWLAGALALAAGVTLWAGKAHFLDPATGRSQVD